MSILFKNLAKSANDLLGSKKYTTGSKKKFSLDTTTANGLKYKAEATVNGDRLSGKIGVELKHPSGLTIKKLSLNDKNELEAELTLAKAVDDVLFTQKFKLCPLDDLEPKEMTTVGLEYKQADYTATFAVSPLDGPEFEGSLCVAKDGWQFGGNGSLTYDLEKGEVSNHGYSLGASYSVDSSTAAVKLNKCKKDADNLLTSYQVSFHRQHSADIAFAATIDGKVNNAASAGLELGGSYKVCAASTVHAKLSSPAGTTAGSTASINYGRKLSDNANLNLTTVLALDGSAAPAFGLGFALGL